VAGRFPVHEKDGGGSIPLETALRAYAGYVRGFVPDVRAMPPVITPLPIEAFLAKGGFASEELDLFLIETWRRDWTPQPSHLSGGEQ